VLTKEAFLPLSPILLQYKIKINNNSLQSYSFPNLEVQFLGLHLKQAPSWSTELSRL
jgi:hypothetical protein